MPQLFNITEEWNEFPWLNTGGTRAKKYLQSPDGKFYYFKCSQVKPGKDYRYEFWNEVIACELGSLLGFKMLRYDVALFDDIMGCISESMINPNEEELIEGVKFLQAFSPRYNPVLKEHQNWYTFYLIKNSLEHAKLIKFLPKVIEIIIFDALIGNGDRHQENWAFIERHVPLHEAIEKMESTGAIEKVNRFFRWVLQWLKRRTERIHQENKGKGKKMPKQFYIPQIKMAPIYDSGSSLGRELTEERVLQLLLDEKELGKYIDRGKSEIHWENKKVSHFDLIRLLYQTECKQPLEQIIRRVIERWDRAAIEKILENVDTLVPDSHIFYKIPANRKRLITKIILLRRDRLAQLINDGV